MGRGRDNEAPMPAPLAYFLTWSTYGTWLPGDERGWVLHGRGWRLPDPIRKLEAEARMTEDACRLDDQQRDEVESQIAETCHFRGWQLHAVNCRSNHLHVVLTASQAPKIVRNQLKAWCTRRLKKLEKHRLGILIRNVSEGGRGDAGQSASSSSPLLTLRVSLDSRSDGEKSIDAAIRENWWAERGSQRFINDEDSLEAAILYVRDGQDRPREHYPEASARESGQAR